MLDCLQRWDRVRFRTEKIPFSGNFAGKFLAEGTPNQTPAALNKKGVYGLVR